ncbi:uncharacterized protein MELLADRAFT_106423 [Melampsora larici-populina 98AG31]|uniref:PWWP domain-containing protein n=1 Tax=Melampsora larici-populina (strain 98AG31 / pathotype 3-4-7) TaxID=747676 RepID=F4RLC0_MELLP|nr:uncharacterized protein MELLADRAFT_106423 [Melampsora larici-populina 98AG31]EGG06898.1 hypothetical protein MELLADRAFT_106423 [Melampsora larici-populina 98AG31]
MVQVYKVLMTYADLVPHRSWNQGPVKIGINHQFFNSLTCFADEISDLVLAKVKGHPAWPAWTINLLRQTENCPETSHLVKFFRQGIMPGQNKGDGPIGSTINQEQEAHLRRQLQHLGALELDEVGVGESKETPAIHHHQRHLK